MTELAEACPVDGAGVELGIDFASTMPYRKVHATASFEGGSAFAGGNLIAIAWRDPDGKIGRLQFDLGPARGYGITGQSPTQPLRKGEALIGLDTHTGLVEWSGGQRTFAGLAAYGIINYQQDHSSSLGGNRHGDFYAQLVYEGVGPAGEARCRLVSVHATTSHDRVDPYDPTWLAPSPTAMIGAAPPTAPMPPTFASDVAPGEHLVAPGDAAPDPGGDPPSMNQNSPTVLSTGSGGGFSACD